jgi:hypothetical protein
MADRQAGKLHSERRFSLKNPCIDLWGRGSMKQVKENRRSFFFANRDRPSALPDYWRISDRKE